MVTDDDRREVAARLRETGEELGSAALLWYHIAKALGVRTATDGKTACDMLADLIEPSEQKVRCVAEVKVDGERLERLANDAAAELTGIDRDALLELADEILENADLSRELHDEMLNEKRLDMALTFHEYACELREYARRIREALGVKDA